MLRSSFSEDFGAFDHLCSTSSSVPPLLRGKVPDVHIELQMMVLWGLLWQHSAVLLRSLFLLPKLLITAGSPQQWPFPDTEGLGGFLRVVWAGIPLLPALECVCSVCVKAAVPTCTPV